MRTYKGTDKNMQCRGKQYELGKKEIDDGERIKADTWYTLINGEFVEVTDDD